MIEMVPPMRSAEMTTEQPDVSGSGLDERMRAIQDRYRSYFRITCDELGAASRQETDELAEWALNMQPHIEQIEEREKWYERDYANRIVAARTLHEKFKVQLDGAVDRQFISGESRQRWMRRFKDQAIGYKAKEYWVQHQFPYYLLRWEEVAKERADLLGNPGFSDLASYEPICALITDTEKFLNLHYDRRKGLLAQCRAALLASRKLQLDLYADAKGQLRVAEGMGILGRGKAGVWLERIFKSSASPKKIEQFVRGNDGTSLTTLIGNWHGVRGRYDVVVEKLRERGESQMPRGLILLNEQQFLSLHYTQRLRYVEQMEDRINVGGDLRAEPESFIRIRHAMDMKDWEEADELILQAEQEPLSETNRERLSSMRRYVTQFRPRQMEGAGGEAVTAAEKRIDEIVSHLDSSVQPMVMKLLSGPNANRSIHQLRWIVYNNIWCRTRNYLTDNIAMQGASKDYRDLTKYRAKWGQDIGRHDVLDWDTADQQYFRKKEFANHKATYLHVNLQSGATNALTEWIQREQDPRVLYWGTLCCHENGMPKSENWHRDFLFALSDIRSATRILKNAGHMYKAPHSRLQSNTSEASFALAA